MHWHSLHGAWRCVGQGIHGGINFPWAHTVDADVLKSIFQCSTFRKTHYAMLECDVGSAPSAPVMPTTDAVLTITPPPWLSICDISYFMHSQ